MNHSAPASAGLGCLLLLGACTSDTTPEVGVAVSDPDSSSDVTASPPDSSDTTSEAPDTSSTTEGSTSTTDGTSSTTDDPEIAVREAHTRFMTELYDADQGFDSQLALNEELVIDPQRRRFAEFVERLREDGRTLQGSGYDSNIVDVVFAPSEIRATVTDCSRDGTSSSFADGSVQFPAEESFKIRTTELENVDGTWKVREFFTGGDTPCEP